MSIQTLKNPSNSDLKSAISKKADFKIEGDYKQSKMVIEVEEILESQGDSVRVKTLGREVSMFYGPAFLAVLSHNLMTYDPDWVIGKNAIGCGIKVSYYG
jgi:hypothetical protein